MSLTFNTFDQTGVGFYDHSFTSVTQLTAEFTYYAGEGDHGDGITFFIVDGDQVDADNIDVGSGGGGLAYAQSDAPQNGIPYAYVGIGFDEYGNFLSTDGGKQGGPGLTPNSVALRGAGNGTDGYEFLTSASSYGTAGFAIDGGWRTARVTVTPQGTTGSNITVELSDDAGTTWHTVIDNYAYNRTPPQNIKVGFSGSTGASINTHAIGNVELTVTSLAARTTSHGHSKKVCKDPTALNYKKKGTSTPSLCKYVKDSVLTVATPVTDQTTQATIPLTIVQKPIPVRNLKYGMTGDDVTLLQQYLISQNKGPAAAELATAGATGNFYRLTQNALKEYQNRHNISIEKGMFGPLTQNYIKSADSEKAWW